MITDDPGTPGPGKWENNVAIAFEHRSDETAYDLPAIDLNYGVGGGVEVSKKISIMAEVHATSRMNFDRQTVALNVGWRHKISEHCIWIASLGHEVRSPADEQLALVGYCGVQLVY